MQGQFFQSVYDQKRVLGRDLTNFSQLPNFEGKMKQWENNINIVKNINQQNQPNSSSFLSQDENSTGFSRVSTQASENLSRQKTTISKSFSGSSDHQNSDKYIEEEELTQDIMPNNNNIKQQIPFQQQQNNFFPENINNNNNIQNNNNNLNLKNTNFLQKLVNQLDEEEDEDFEEIEALIKKSKLQQQQQIQNRNLLLFNEQFKNKRNNPQLVTEYKDNIVKYMISIEKNYMPQNLTITKRRATILDWLISIQLILNLKCETLQIAMGIFDRFVEKKQLQLNHNTDRLMQFFQNDSFLFLSAGTCLFLSAKYEEIYPPSLDQFAQKLKFSKDEIIECEGQILQLIGFTLTQPTPLKFVEALATYDENFNNEKIYLAKFLVELALHDTKLCGMLPSKMASSAMVVVNKLYDMNSPNLWTEQQYSLTQYNQTDLENIGNDLFSLLISILSSPGSSVYKKFSQESRYFVVQKSQNLLQQAFQHIYSNKQ